LALAGTLELAKWDNSFVNLQNLSPAGSFSAASSVMWEVAESAGGDEIEAGIFCLLLCVFLLATAPIWVTILFFSRKYKDPN
jgi:hypothetical protein